MATKIEWTEETWNPIVGCSPASPGCDHCYAAGVAAREMQPVHVGLTIGRKWTGELRLLPDRLGLPATWARPRRVFVGSMTDIFHPDVPETFIADIFDTMACHGNASRHTYQVLTKRPRRMRELLTRWAVNDGYEGAPNVWLGTSIESDRYAWRADHLRGTPAAVRWLSLEPLLGPLPSLNLDGIDWVVAGGESGPGARPMHPEWVRDIRDRCVAAGVPFLFKQWGAWRPFQADDNERGHVGHVNLNGDWRDEHNPGPAHPGAELVINVGKGKAGRVLDGRTWDEYPAAQR